MRSKPKPALILTLLIVLSCILALGSFYLKQKEETNKTVTESVRVMEDEHSILYLPQYVALRKGFFNEENLNVEIKTINAKDALNNYLADGRADILLTGMEYTVYNQTGKKENLVSFASIARKDDAYLISRNKEKPFQWNDLKNKTIITGSPEDRNTVLLEAILRKHGLAPNHQVILFSNIPASIRSGAFKTGTGDYILLNEPEASLMEEGGTGKIVASLGEETGQFPVAVYSADKSYFKNHTEAIGRFTNAIHKSLLWLNQHGAYEIAQLIQPDYEQIDNTLLIDIINRCQRQNTWVDTTVTDPDQYDYFLKLLIEARAIPGPIPFRKIVDNRFAESALKNNLAPKS